MEQILLAYCLPIETVTAIMMLHKNTKVKTHSLDEDAEFFGIVARRYISPKFVHNLPRLQTLNIDRSNKRKWIYTKNSKNQTISRRNYNKCRQCI